MISNCGSVCREPFIIGIFYGLTKPSSHEFLEEFIAEGKELENHGFVYDEERVLVKISAVVCDAPACSFLKNIKGHGGYSGCGKCVQRGVWLEKVTFPETNAALRTDDSFSRMIDEEHHVGPTPFAELSIGLVTAFPLDYMHLVCLGVMRRLLNFWLKGPLRTRMGSFLMREISERLVSLCPFIPMEFCRKPRHLKYVDRWKATEFRQFLLYTGPVALLGKLPDDMYKNFMLLSVSIAILLKGCPHCSVRYCDYVHGLLVHFVTHFGQIYGQNMITYNVHGLVHLSEDVKLHGTLNNFSCFPFENYLGQLKRLVRSPSLPFEQVIRSISEHNESYKKYRK
ncbi:hypothetical protein HOLleu_10154 [Holothuria leucospilota]|uniref:Transposase domain-containing protein n=1 Tax=Holothuria leucospilota TaxID=206669 RepID=A0A9Q1CDX7_HOLLE|nr:hypothetical protein HOLleu_10154 [Holothuria leucospilota]